MKEYWPIIVVGGIAFAIFAVLWRQGAFLRLSGYWNETWEELKKCTWPTWEELMGSTVVVIVTVAALGAFTVGVDYAVINLIKLII